MMRSNSYVLLLLAAYMTVGGVVRAKAEGPPTGSTLAPPTLERESHAHPPYPPDADGQPARVSLQLTIDTEGRVTEATVLETDREADAAAKFERPAIDYCKGLSFNPATRDGQPISARIGFEVFFDAPGATPQSHGTPESAHSHLVSGGPETGQAPAFAATAIASPLDQSASAMDLSGEEIRLRPYLSTGDLLNAAPGLFSIQHAGGGKANQYFLRGFDADHGTDIAFYVDGVPINWVSHGHGQGYTDLHFVIPELIERLELRKGPYYAEYGDFSTAGTINIVLDADKPSHSFTLLGGTQRTFRGLAIVSPKLDKVKPLFAVDVLGSDGPFDKPEDLLRFNLFAKTSFELGGGRRLAITGGAYGASWEASGQIPLREVEAGRLDRFGSIDPNEGGQSERYSLYLSFAAPAEAGALGERSVRAEGLQLVTWLTRSEFALYSNFTFYAQDPVNGDMIRQGDTRTAFGTRLGYGFVHRFDEVLLKTRLGGNFRMDLINNSLQQAPAREVLDTLVDAAIREANVGLFAEEELDWRWFRLIGGLRFDWFDFAVDDRLEDRDEDRAQRSAVLVSPKASFIVQPVESLQLFVNFGRGFHSNDARGVVREVDPVTPLAAALGWELGARVVAWDRLELSAAVFWLDLDSEVVWIGDEGTTEASGASRRFGVETQLRAELFRWLLADAELSWVRAELLDEPASANAIPLAPDLLLSAGLTALDERTGLSGRIGILYLGDRPATEDRFLTAQGFFRVDLSLGWENERLGFTAQVLNLLNRSWRQAQFATTGRLPGEDAPSDCPPGTRPISEQGSFVGCEDLHFTPGWPIHFQASVTVKF